MTRPVLTYDTATPEQVAEARAEARRKLAEVANRDPAEREQARRDFLARLDAHSTPAE